MSNNQKMNNKGEEKKPGFVIANLFEKFDENKSQKVDQSMTANKTKSKSGLSLVGNNENAELSMDNQKIDASVLL